MQILLEMGPEFRQTIAELGSMGDAVSRASGIGLDNAVHYAASHVVSQYLTGQVLKTRSKMLKNAVQGWLVSDSEGIVGVKPNSGVEKYKWLLGDESKTITPRRGKFLAIPIGENLTGAGVARFTSPRQVPDGFFVSSKGRLLFGIRHGKKGKFRPYFTLVKSVDIQGSGALYDGVMDSVDDMASAIQAEVDKVVDK